MKRQLVLLKLVTLFIVVAAWAVGCGKGKKGAGTTAAGADSASAGTKSKEPDYDYELYAPLPRMLKEVTLPMLVDADGVVEKSCFKLKEELNTTSADMQVKAEMQKQPELLKSVISKWLLDEIGIYGITEDDIASWDVTTEYPVMLEIDPTALRFVDDQECIGENGWLDEGVRAVTGLIGTRNFKFESSKRLSVDTQDNLKESLEKAGFTMEGKDMDLYKPVLDEEGAQKYDDNEQALYTGPGGVNMREKDLPPEAERGIKEWTVKSEDPIYFAFQQLPNDAWQKEDKKKDCNVFLVWGDVTPRKPDCEEFDSVEFVVEKNKKDDTIKIEITLDDKTETINTPYEETQKLMMANRAILWVNAKKEEEGVTIRLNSLVIGELFPNKK